MLKRDKHPVPWAREGKAIHDADGRLVARAASKSAAKLLRQAPRMRAALQILLDMRDAYGGRPFDPERSIGNFWGEVRDMLGLDAPPPRLEPPELQPRAERTDTPPTWAQWSRYVALSCGQLADLVRHHGPDAQARAWGDVLAIAGRKLGPDATGALEETDALRRELVAIATEAEGTEELLGAVGELLRLTKGAGHAAL